MESSVQDNPAAPSQCQYTLKALLNSVIGQQSNSQFTQHFLNRLMSSRTVSTSTAISGCFQPGQAKVLLGPTPLLLTLTILEIPEAEFLDVIGTQVLPVFLLAFHSHPPPPPPIPSIVYGNLKPENSQDQAQKPQRNCTFMIRLLLFSTLHVPLLVFKAMIRRYMCLSSPDFYCDHSTMSFPAVVKFIVPEWGIQLTPAQGCRTAACLLA